MYYGLFTLTAVLSLTGLVTASPIIRQRQETTTTVTPPSRYYLQTKVIGSNNDVGTNKNGLWVYSYHTGAGLGDVGLSANKSSAWEGYLNGTQQLFTYPDAFAPWPLNIKYGPYQDWSVATINLADQTVENAPGFYFNSTGLQYNSSSSAGWLACDWWHGVPQLFSLSGSRYGQIAPSCSQVELYPVAI